MTKIKKIESDILSLSPDELKELRKWFEDFDVRLWDSQFENDVKSGKLDGITYKAINDFKNGNLNVLS